MHKLLTAPEQDNDYESEGCARKISRDGRRAYLGNTDKYDMRALFAYPTGAEGRKVRGSVLADATPLIDKQGRPALPANDEIHLISQASR